MKYSNEPLSKLEKSNNEINFKKTNSITMMKMTTMKTTMMITNIMKKMVSTPMKTNTSEMTILNMMMKKKMTKIMPMMIINCLTWNVYQQMVYSRNLQWNLNKKVLHFYLALAILIFGLSFIQHARLTFFNFCQKNWIYYIPWTAYKKIVQNIFSTTFKLLTGQLSYENRILRFVTATS